MYDDSKYRGRDYEAVEQSWRHFNYSTNSKFKGRPFPDAPWDINIYLYFPFECGHFLPK